VFCFYAGGDDVDLKLQDGISDIFCGGECLDRGLRGYVTVHYFSFVVT
jgi:hypothetical protein